VNVAMLRLFFLTLLLLPWYMEATQYEDEIVQEVKGYCQASQDSSIRARCLQFMGRVNGAGRKTWRRELARSLGKLAWGMPDCDVDRKLKEEKSGGCDNVSSSLASFAFKPLVIHTVNNAMDWQHFSVDSVLTCKDSCIWAGRVEPLRAADVLVFDCLTTPTREMRERNPRAVWLFLCMESEFHVRRMKDPQFMSLFDIAATYRLTSQLPLLYAPGNLSLYDYGAGQEPTKLLVWIASNCAPARVELVEELMRVVEVHSYGQCLHNRDFPSVEKVFGSEKIPLLAQYKFVLAMENSFVDDYVTEKFYQALIAGSVPIYLGAPNIHEFAPSPNSFIDMRSFETVSQLADYIRYLDWNASAYKELHAWRRRPLPHHFRKHASLGFNQGSFYGEKDMRQDPCRICSEVAALIEARRKIR